MTLPKIGKKAPDFALSDQEGREHSPAIHKGGFVLVYFYPKDMTSGCTLEAEGFRDAFKEFSKRKITILGVSPDSAESHGKFCNKYNLPFPLLADIDKKAAHAYGVWVQKSMYGRTYMGIERSSFLIDPKGVLVKEWRKVKPIDHPKEILEDFDAIKK